MQGKLAARVAPVQVECLMSSQHGELREFAVTVVRRLRDAGYEALWAGGCVRDELLGLCPKDYDVATDAAPDRVRRVFGARRTLGIGAAFGVIAVLGPKKLQVEVATFRQDGVYSDGRHPDDVVFSTAQHDAQRRDFTINGMFFDPLGGRVIDYVGGVGDLERRVVRAIGNPQARFDEDKLRMLRAARFAAVYDFQIEPATFEAMQQLAGELVIVSAERIADEMRKMLSHPNRARAVELLRASRLLEVVLPESRAFDAPATASGDGSPSWQRTLQALRLLREPSFPVALAALLHELSRENTSEGELVETVGARWRLSKEEITRAAWVQRHEAVIRNAKRTPWPKLQRILIAPFARELLQFAEAIAKTRGESSEHLDYCREKLALPHDELNPAPLLTGDDLIRAGLKPGPRFRELIESARDAQLDGLIRTKEEALRHALASASSPPTNSTN